MPFAYWLTPVSRAISWMSILVSLEISSIGVTDFVQVIAHFIDTVDVQIAVVIIAEHDPGMVGKHGEKLAGIQIEGLSKQRVLLILIRLTGGSVAKTLKIIYIDMAGHIEIPGVEVIRHAYQFRRLIGRGAGEEINKIFSNPVYQGTQSAAGICCLAGRPQHVDQRFGSDVVTFVGNQVGHQTKVGQTTLFRRG